MRRHSPCRNNVIRTAIALLATASTLFGKDTAGSTMRVKSFSHPGLTKLTWTAQISEYESKEQTNDQPYIRIEFNQVHFRGHRGIMDVGAMIQNVSHTFADDAYGATSAQPPALGLYFTALQTEKPELKDSEYGVQLNVPPTKGPHFGRMFEDVDGGGHIGKNVYSRAYVGKPAAAKPVVVRWMVTKGSQAVDPPGQFSRDIHGAWISLKGTFVKWNFTVWIDGAKYNVADYYLPIGCAEFLSDIDPLSLHQEYFGSAHKILTMVKGTVRYTKLQASDGHRWYPLNHWIITWRIEHPPDNPDDHFGWKSDGHSLTSSVGHEDDPTQCARDEGHEFVLQPR